MTGSSAQIQPVLEGGGAGALTGNGNVFPSETKAIINAFNAGKDMTAAQEKLNGLTSILKGYASAEAQKACLHLKGLGKMYVRAPFVDLSEAQRKELAQRMRAVGVLS
jgi:dihydrodipicolinate synthase/N-acetylneuraminate lyase